MDLRKFVVFSSFLIKYSYNEAPLDKTSARRKIEHIISVNREEPIISQDIGPHKDLTAIEDDEEAKPFWSKFLLRSDIIGIAYVMTGLLLNSQRNLFLDVDFLIILKKI